MVFRPRVTGNNNKSTTTTQETAVRLSDRETLWTTKDITIFTANKCYILSQKCCRGERTVHNTPFSVNLRVLDVRVFNGWVIVLYKHLLKELDRQCRLAYSAVADYDNLVGGHVVDRWLFRHFVDGPSRQQAYWQPGEAWHHVPTNCDSTNWIVRKAQLRREGNRLSENSQ